MKYSKKVSISKKKNKKKSLKSNSTEKQKSMCVSLSKNLREKYNIKSIPIRKNDEVKVIRGSMKGKIGKIIECRRNKFSICIKNLVHRGIKRVSYFPVSFSNTIIINLYMTKERKRKITTQNIAQASGL